MQKLRELQSGGYLLKTDITAPNNDLKAWVVKKAEELALQWMLAHADDGVIWGRVENGELLTSHDVFGTQVSPKLRFTTLQQLRLFGPEGELLLWQGIQGWQARLATDSTDGAGYYDEAQMLWGNWYIEPKKGFTWVEEGQQGMMHAPPIDVPSDCFGETDWPLRLGVRHYLVEDQKTGLVHIALSRLTDITYAKNATEVNDDTATA